MATLSRASTDRGLLAFSNGFALPNIYFCQLTDLMFISLFPVFVWNITRGLNTKFGIGIPRLSLFLLI